MNDLFMPQQITLNEMHFISVANGKQPVKQFETVIDKIFDDVSREIAMACELIAKHQSA